LPGRRGGPLIQRPGPLLRQRPVQLLALCRQRCVQLLTLLIERMLGVPAGCAAAGNLHSHRSDHGKTPTSAAMIAAMT
jgi:hypothetical protein